MEKLFPHPLQPQNEADVRETIIRPFLHRLGYCQGTTANIRTETTLRYDRAFLGRKNEARDPKLQGRADYICEVIPHARWVVEAKPPSAPLTSDDAQQAHTYAAHPEVAASFYLLSNGKEFQVYRTSYPDKPLLCWRLEDMDEMLAVVEGLLGPEMLKKRTNKEIDVGKPIARGLGSRATIVGGHVVYDKHVSSHPLLDARLINGTRNAISGKRIERNAHGQIEALVSLESAFSGFDEINRMMRGEDSVSFIAQDEMISSDRSAPSFFDNIAEMTYQKGTRFPAVGTMPASILPFDIRVTCLTRAAGFLEDDHFRGIFALQYLFKFDYGGFRLPFSAPKEAHMLGEGTFDLAVR